MAKLRYQVNFLAVCLILIPWSIVVLFHNQFWINTAIPYASKEDLGEVEALAMAVQQYAFTYGAYPPDFTSGDPRGELDRHLAQCFPNRDAELDVPLLLDELGPHNALAFWLHGFSPDPKRPIRGWGRRRILFAFDPGRLSLADEYFPSSCSAPYVYFRSDTYEKAKYVSKPNLGTAWPYFSKRPSKMGSHAFVEPNSFQIISAGSDGVYGDKQVAASEAYLYHGHQDNLVKFCPEPLGHEGLTEQLRRHRKCCQISIAIAVLCTLYYPIVYQIRIRPNGLDVMRRMLVRQFKVTPRSESWQERIEEEKQKRRRQVIDRITKHGNTSTSPTKKTARQVMMS